MLFADKDQITIVSNKTKQVVKTPVKDILGVQRKQFSARKSIGIPAAALITAILINAVFGEQPSSSGDDQ